MCVYIYQDLACTLISYGPFDIHGRGLGCFEKNVYLLELKVIKCCQ